MKIHITNLYNHEPGDLLKEKQHDVTEIAISLGFREIPVFSCSGEECSSGAFSEKLDEIFTMVEPDDVVIFQLPTGNGLVYEKAFVQKARVCQTTKLILLFHDVQLLSRENEMHNEYQLLCEMADAVVSFDEGELKSEFYTKKVLLDAVESAFESQNKETKARLREKEDEIQIGFGLHDRTGDYSVWVGVAMQSVIEHTSAPICFHILHDDTLTELNRNRLTQVATQSGNRVIFHALDRTMWEDLAEQMSFYTIGALFRVMLPEFLPNLTKIIYLDADILANRDIKELWDIDIHDYSMAAVPDVDVVNGIVRPIVVKRKEVSNERYFNSGVLYMNLERIRQKGSMRKSVLDFLKNTRESNLPDQDALNVIYGEETLLLDGSWNSFVRPLQNRGEKVLEKRLYHLVGTRCILYSLSEIDVRYYETTCRTPWGIEEGRKQLRKSFERSNYRLDQLEKLLAQVSDYSQKHIFYGEETNSMRNIYQLLSIREGDYRILGEPQDEVNPVLPCRPFSALEEEKEKFIVFVLPEADNGTSLERLDKMGLKRDVDYFVIPCLLPPNKGGYM